MLPHRLCPRLLPGLLVLASCGDDLAESITTSNGVDDSGTSATSASSADTTGTPATSTTADTSGGVDVSSGATSVAPTTGGESTSDATTGGPETSASTGDATGTSTSGDVTTSGATTGDATTGNATTTDASTGVMTDGSSTGATALCGNGLIDGDDVCDGDDLGGEDCISRGFDAGTLACLKNCSDFDTSACESFTCGNGLVEGNEVCDGNDHAGADCISLGFDAGTLGCADNCGAFDTTGCVHFTCGNDLIEGVEVCDGSDLAGSDCIGLGYDAGTLACADNCAAYDVSGCQTFACGNDVIEGVETCDGIDLAGVDCVSEGFLGGTITCLADCSGYDTSACFLSQCGDDTIEASETCDGTDLGGATCQSQGFSTGTLGCLGDCSDFDTSACIAPGCGNGVIDGGEDCDGADLGGATCVSQGATSGTLTCTAGCHFDTTGCLTVVAEAEPNDDGAVAVATNDFLAANANGPYTGHTQVVASISPIGDDDGFAVTNPSSAWATVRLETFGSGGVGTCNVDTVMEVRTAANVLVTSDDDSGVNSCSLLPSLVLGPGQTLYVRVIEFGDNDPASYMLDIQVVPVVCGDNALGAGEQCDDGGLVDGDGCSSTCRYEAATQEIEPNDTLVQADATGLSSTGNSLYGGSISVAGDLDRYRIDLAAPTLVRFETFSSPGACANLGTTLTLYDSVGTQLATDNSSGISSCSAIEFPFETAGTYYVQVGRNGNNGVVPTYLLEIDDQISQGSETEINDALAQANTNIQTAGTGIFVAGDHSVATDSDYYAIDVPVAGSSLRLEVVEGNRTVETCESNGVDSRITLYNALGTQLVDDDDDSRGFCSLIDGTGATPLDAGAHNLAAGTYYVQVRASSLSQAGAAGQFVYRLAATIRTP